MKFDHPLTREQQHLVEQNISLIHWTIWKYIDVKEEICGLAYDDLHQEGALALCYADSFRDQIKQTLSERASQNEAQAGDGVERVSASRVMPDNGDHFAIGGVIDGERDLLPA